MQDLYHQRYDNVWGLGPEALTPAQTLIDNTSAKHVEPKAASKRLRLQGLGFRATPRHQFISLWQGDARWKST